MAVAFDAFASGSDAGGSSNLTWTHTPVGTPRGVLVWIIQTGFTPSGTNAVSCAYGAADMGSPVAELIKTTGEVCTVTLYFLGESIPTGAQTVTFDPVASAVKLGGSITLTADTDTEIVDTDDSINSDSVANPSATLSLAARTCFAAIGFFSGQGADTGITPLSSWTARLEHDFTPAMGAVYTYDTIGTSDVTAGWTQGADDAVGISAAVSEVAAAAAGAVIVNTMF